MQIIERFLRDERAATAVEYCLIVAGIALAIMAGMNSVSTSIKTVFTNVSTSLK
ncbi:MAG: Flp family type IVb pilin [Xanthobacteraceae bacterium]|nr:Flp family type IVb pilin [Xanthobacteraceae bacterium]